VGAAGAQFNYAVQGQPAFQQTQEIGQPQNRIIMHSQDRDVLRRNLHNTIF
jgi:hypothetical protein